MVLEGSGGSARYNGLPEIYCKKGKGIGFMHACFSHICLHVLRTEQKL